MKYYQILQNNIVLAAYRRVSSFKRSFIAKRNPIEAIANTLTNGDPTFKRFRDNHFAPIALLLNRVGVSPNAISIAGLLFAIFATLNVNSLYLFPLFIFLNLVCDGLDGVVARLSNRDSDFGSILDVCCDTISLVLVACGLMFDGKLVLGVGIPYIAIVAFYTYRSAIKNRILAGSFLSVGSRILAFAGLFLISISLFADSISTFQENLIHYLFISMALVLSIALIQDIISTKKWTR